MPDLPTAFVFYDTETSGLSKAFDQILQIAAVRMDADLNVDPMAADSFTLRARRLPWVVPSPAAMMVTRLTPTDSEVQPLSSHELLAEVTRRFEAWSPAIFIGHNTIRFDEEMLRHGLFAALQDPHITQINGNMRADTLIMLHAVHLIAPGSITIPMVPPATANLEDSTENVPKALRLRPSFRLGDIARANGITLDEGDAHDALADVKATIKVARLISDKAPDILRMMLANASKAHVLGQLQQPWLEFDAIGKTGTDALAAEAEFVVFDFPETAALSDLAPPFEPLLLGHVFGANAKLTPVLFIGTLADNKNAAIVVDLTIDPDGWMHGDAEALGHWMADNPRAFQKVRINAFPILAPFGIAAEHRSPVFMDVCRRLADSSVAGSLDQDVAKHGAHSTSAVPDAAAIAAARTILAERMLRIMAHLTVNPEARDMILAAYAARQKVYPLSPFIEENLYTGFPSTANRTLAHRMQTMSIAERVRHIPVLQDARLREHAWRWVFADDPEALPPAERQRLTEWMHQRIRGSGDPEEKLPYLTISQALEAVVAMHAAERETLASLPEAERAAAMQRFNALLDSFVFINATTEGMLDQQKALVRASTIVTSGFDGIIAGEETIRWITGEVSADRSSPDAPPDAPGG